MKERITQLDGLRAVAIVSVFITHAASVPLLWMGVDLFFVLSGFLITGILVSAKSKGIAAYFGNFYERRARRILPPYLLLLVVTSILFGLGWVRHWYLYLFLMNLLQPLGVQHPGPLNVLWSLAVEEQFYLLWPLVVFFLSEEQIVWAAGALVVAAPILRWTCTPLFVTETPIGLLTPFRMDTLALGAVLAIAWRRHRNKITAYGVYGPIASLIALGVLLVLKEQMPSARLSANSPLSNTLTYECTLMICGGVILWALSGRFVGILNWAPVRYLGRVSYSVYLIHLVPMHFLRFYYHGPKIVGWVAVVVATLAYAALSWHFFEQPILAGRPRGSTRRRMEEEERAAGGATLEVGDTQVPMLELAASPPSETAP